MKFILIRCVLFWVALVAPLQALTKPLVAVYPAWLHTDKTLQQLPWGSFNYLAVSGFYPLPSGHIQTEAPADMLSAVSQHAHQQGKKVILSIGGAGQGSKGFLALTASAAAQDAFIQRLKQWAHQYALEGIDIDWEYWTYQSELQKGGQDIAESGRLLQLMAALRQAFPRPFILTADIAPGPWLGPQYSPQLQEHVDWVNLMAFDFTGAWQGSEVGYHAEFKLFKRALEHTLQRGFLAEKVVVGIPAYGIEFVDGKTTQVRHVNYANLLPLLQENPRALNKGRLNNTYFEGPNSVTEKCRWLTQKGFAGAFVFHVLADSQDDKSLLKACVLGMLEV